MFMEETVGYDTPSLAQELGLDSQSEHMDIQPELDTETPYPNLSRPESSRSKTRR